MSRGLKVASCALVMVAGGAANAELIYGVTLQQTLVSWDSGNPGSLNSGVPIWGMLSNEVVRGIDIRPATNELVAVGSFGRLYTVNPATGMATFEADLSAALNGSSFGVDFNPTVDRLRVVSDTRQNLRINPDTGATIVDGMLNYVAGDVNFGATPNITAAAYTNNFAGATSTQLFVVDTGLDALVLQNPANSGNLVTIGAIGTDVSDLAGFDISGVTGVAYMTIRDANLSKSTFWTINLATGQGSFVGEVGGGAIITAMTVAPTPGTAGVLAIAGVLAARRRRS